MNDEIRRGVACLVAYRDEWEARAEADDWSGWWYDLPATATARAIESHYQRLRSAHMERTHE